MTDKQQATSIDDEYPTPTADDEGQEEPTNQPGTDRDEDSSDFDESTFSPRRTMNHANELVHGTLTVYYPERDVQLYTDGDAAMRLMTAFREGQFRDLEDGLDPSAPIARNAWFALEMNPLAMWWYPRFPSTRSDRMTLDPQPVDA